MKKTNNESGDTSIETCQSETQREKIITKIISENYQVMRYLQLMQHTCNWNTRRKETELFEVIVAVHFTELMTNTKL